MSVEENFRPSSKLLEAAELADPGTGGGMLLQTGSSSLFAIKSIEGSLGCQHFIFFKYSEAKGAELIQSPKYLMQKDGFCPNHGSWIAQIHGATTFALQWAERAKDNITIIPMGKSGFEKPCDVVSTFTTKLTLRDAYCKEGDCGLFGSTALIFASEYDQNRGHPPKSAQVLEGDPATKLMDLATSDTQTKILPSFGARVGGYSSFGNDSTTFAVELNGKPYLVRIGNGTLGWRISEDYLVAFFQLGSEKLNPVAGIYIARERDALAGIEVRPSSQP